MNLIVGAPMWLSALLLVALIAAAVEDILRLRISNPTCEAVFILAIAAMAIHGFQLGLWQNFVGFVLILALGTFAFASGWLGGGDVKLLAALGLWVDFHGLLLLLSAIFVAGGVIALIYLAARAGRSRRSGTQDRRIPYGLAITAGALIAFGMQESKPAPNPYIAKLRSSDHR